MKVQVHDVPRARDEQVLRWLALRWRGSTYREIAAREGRTPEAVRIACTAVMRADVRESGEPEAEVRRFY